MTIVEKFLHMCSNFKYIFFLFAVCLFFFLSFCPVVLLVLWPFGLLYFCPIVIWSLCPLQEIIVHLKTNSRDTSASKNQSVCDFDLYLIGVFDSIEHPYQVVIKVSHWLLSIVNFQMFFTSNAKKGLTLFAKLIKGRPDNLFLPSTCLSQRKTCKAKRSPNWKSVQLEICTYLLRISRSLFSLFLA